MMVRVGSGDTKVSEVSDKMSGGKKRKYQIPGLENSMRREAWN